jgi:hypothetical protein
MDVRFLLAGTRLAGWFLAGWCLLATGCAGINDASPNGTAGTKGTGTGNGPGSGGSSGAAGAGAPIPACNGVCTDFPVAAIIDGSVPSNAAMIFGAPGAGASGGPCILEPQDGTLFPNNWLRPRFSFAPPSGSGLIYEIRVEAPNQANPLVVYTASTTWTMPKDIWQALAAHTREMEITVTVRSAPASGGAVSISTPAQFTIAPVAATGKMVYWSTSGVSNGPVDPTATLLSGFAVGDESVVQVLTPSQVAPTWQTWKQDNSLLQPVTCIGCHTSTPDGAFISFNNFYPWGAVLASGATGNVGATPTFIAAGGKAAIIQPWVGITTYAKGHWSNTMPTEHIMVAPLATKSDSDLDQQSGLAWFDLESAAPASNLQGSAWNWIYQPAPGSGLYAAAPSWSHDAAGSKIVFTMTSSVVSGRIGSGTAHLATVPYSKTGAQMATLIPGDASDTNFAQYYGTLSDDDALIVYNEVPRDVAANKHPDLNVNDTGQPGALWDGTYAQPQTQLYVIAADGTGGKVRLKANDPPACPGQPTSPGINNSWGKWSPSVGSGSAGKYYWIIFSSWRDGHKYPNGSPIAQLYMTAIVVSELRIDTYPAVYLWNQPASLSNHTPAWDVFQIPDIQ